MRREVTLEEISDGKLYQAKDMAAVDCEDCNGCSACCAGMGNSLVLDPYDIYQLTVGLGTTFAELMQGKIELNMVDGVVLPNMAMNKENEKCGFLNEEGRCGIHSIRPGICRLFPLGRYYENGNFRYFLQVHECKKRNRKEMQIKEFLGIENLREYEIFITDWHQFLKKQEKEIIKSMQAGEDAKTKALTMEILQQFYLTPYESGDFFEQYYARKKKIRMEL